MSPEFLLFILMVGVFAAGCFLLKWPVAASMLVAATAGALAGGLQDPIRHLVEGTFGYVDTILTIATAMMFMMGFRDSGALEALTAVVVKRFHKVPSLLMILLTLVIMVPGMITGSSTASVLTAGAVVAPMFFVMGMSKVDAGALISLAAILGMIAPPVNIPVMIIGGGIDMPYVGFEIPLLLLTIPLAIVFALWFGWRKVRGVDQAKVVESLDFSTLQQYGAIKLFAPIVVVLVLMVLEKAFPRVLSLGMPLIFLLGTALTWIAGKRFDILQSARKAMEDALPVLGILVGVGMLIQVMTATGVRGFIVVNALSVPQELLLVMIAISIPLFGAISAFGAASVLGVPFMLALLGRDQIITAASLSLIAALGDFMPPTALAAIFAAKVVGIEKYGTILKKLLVPALLIIAVALTFILFSRQIRALY
ncbi:MAG: TRAP transporter large permease subunit [Rectinemataceae bacterium]|nr:TRAP transporter large permease subunit [Spirochaetaceae bacterium]